MVREIPDVLIQWFEFYHDDFDREQWEDLGVAIVPKYLALKYVVAKHGQDHLPGMDDPVREALGSMIDLITSGRHYETRNPYSRPEVEQAYKALGRDWRTEGMS